MTASFIAFIAVALLKDHLGWYRGFVFAGIIMIILGIIMLGGQILFKGSIF